MPVERRPFKRPQEHKALAGELALELKKAAETGPPDAPVIIEEGVRPGHLLHVTVLWDKWKDLDPEDRGRVIMDAYQEARGEKEALNIVVAMGLTHEEAERLGVG